MESQKYAIVDLETTGHSSKNGDRIIQIAIVIMRNWQVEQQFSTFVDPGQPIPAHITDLTHIRDEDVRYAMPFEAHADYVYELLEDSVFVAHNVDFDLNFLQQEFQRIGMSPWQGRFVDTVELTKIMYPTALSFKLGDLAADLHIPLQQAHRADEDALATAQLLAKCYEEILTLPQATIEQLHKRAFRLKSNIAHLLFDALREKRTMQETREDLLFYGRLAIQKEPHLDKTDDVETAYPQTTQQKMALCEKAYPQFEERPAQFQMMDVVWEALKARHETVIEASTGIGKSLGYLLPAILYAKRERKKIAISTYTSYLQEQLLQEELQKVERILGTTVHVALLKGMQHYVDLERVTQLVRQEPESYDETLALLQVIVWLTKTVTGDLSELTVSGGGQLVLDRLRKSVSGPTGAVDYYTRALKRSRHAEVIITNHAMLLAETTRKTPLYQEVGGWIIDEAHQMVQAAIQQHESIFQYTQWKYIFGQIGTSEEHQLFRKLYKRALKTRRVSMNALLQAERSYVRMTQSFERAVQQMVQVLQNEQLDAVKQTVFLQQIALPEQAIRETRDAVVQWLAAAKQIATYFSSGTEPLVVEDMYLLNDWHYLIREMTIKVAEWERIFIQKDVHYTTWLELDQRSLPGSLHVLHKPLHVARTIQQLFQQQRGNIGIIWTSGTMTVPHNPHFITEQLGMKRRVPVHQFQAPQSYYAGAKMMIVSDMPDVQTVSQQAYVEAIAKGIIASVQQTEGRSFVLFTSQQMLKETVAYIQETEALTEYMLFAQGVTGGSRMRLLKAFQKFQRSVLFGTNSFWEGVDVPGDALSAVIVARLPFSSPEDPIFKARANMYEQQHKNSFLELALPEAIMRFKQGFGRLIRSSHDRGVFIVLDRRIHTKSYGQQFIDALPPIDVQKLSLEDMVLALEHWYNNER